MPQTTRYARVLAKMGSERSQLLNESKQKALTQTRNLAEFIAQLRETTYQAQISKLQSPLTSRKLERAFKENLIETYWIVINNSPKNIIPFILLFLEQFEVENIKTLIKTTNAQFTPEAKLAKMYLSAEEHLGRRSLLESAAKAQGIRQTISAFKDTELSLPLKMGLSGYEEDGSTTCLDVLLDKHFFEKLTQAYENLPQKEKPHAYPYVSLEVDGYVLLTLLRGKNLNYDPQWLRFAVPSKKLDLSEQIIERILAAQDFDSALKVVLESKYAKFFSKAGPPNVTMHYAEEALQKAVFFQAKESRFTEIFNIGAVLGFLVQKQAEVHNLIAVSLGVESSFKPQDIEQQLLI